LDEQPEEEVAAPSAPSPTNADLAKKTSQLTAPVDTSVESPAHAHSKEAPLAAPGFAEKAQRDNVPLTVGAAESEPVSEEAEEDVAHVEQEDEATKMQHSHIAQIKQERANWVCQHHPPCLTTLDVRLSLTALQKKSIGRLQGLPTRSRHQAVNDAFARGSGIEGALKK